jgi:hypothetical protein
MSGANGVAIVTAGGPYRLRALNARVEKLRSGSGLRDDRERSAENSASNAARRNASSLSRYETVQSEPLWNGPQLNAAFVAQLLGQVLADPAADDGRSALAAYRERAWRAGTLDQSA